MSVKKNVQGFNLCLRFLGTRIELTSRVIFYDDDDDDDGRW